MGGSRDRLIIGLCFCVLIILIAGGAANPARAGKRVGWYGEALCGDSLHYDCLTITAEEREVVKKRRGRKKTVIRKVAPTWEELWPDEREREIVMKVNRMNYRLRDGMKIAVPIDMDSKTFMDFSPFPRLIAPLPEKLIIFDPSIIAFAAYDEAGGLTRWGPAVGGKNWCGDVGRRCLTPVGEFRVRKKAGAGYRSSSYPIDCWDNCARMPWPVFFSGGVAFHAGYLPGRHQSHGCVRLFYEDARWLNREFARRGTRVIVMPYGDSA